MRIQKCELLFKEVPVYFLSQQYQFVVHIYKIFQQRPEKFALIPVW